MKTIFDHIERVKKQPHHVRKRVAFGAAYAATGLIAVVWLGTSLSSGAFALHDSNFAAAEAGAGNERVAGNAAPQQLAGAAAALRGVAANAPAHIEIVDATSTSSAPREQTVIPF